MPFFLLRLLLIQLFAGVVLLAACDGVSAVELFRNGAKYEFDVPLPGGAKFQSAGVDRNATIRGIGINLHLIQDRYPDCKTLVRERMVGVAGRRYRYDDESAVLTKGECRIKQWNNENVHITSHCIWVEICGCYAIVHFTYPYELEDRYQKISAAVALALRRASSAGAQKTFRRDGLDEDWLAAIRVLKKRGFSASQAHAFLQDSAHIEVGPRGLLDRYAKLLADLYGTSVKSVQNGPAVTATWAYDVQTGYPLHVASPVESQGTLRLAIRELEVLEVMPA
ncbi:hypothetical protein ABK249_28240 [Neorhizobium sp. Rsf11]|uniref:Uncharacterized protein n=2 Tax=Neorhizobium TaxID=1525371 RepID=A0ABV0MA90_9HYPH|nr:hypothetical protein [Neorhizobium petrolearium]MCC2613910.1 hypothetical protein [Neorhizobium petrolearium]WGI71433.1 hypothetical protein QEO92_29275 [Neorhizobium petrolearium]